MTGWTRGRALVPLLLLLGAVVRLWWALAFAPQPTSDFAWYVARGLALAHGQGYTIGGIPTAYFPPGYPFFLGLLFTIFGDGLLVARLGNVVLQVGALFLLYATARELVQSEAQARAALLLAALYPNAIAGVALPGSEHLFIFLMLLGTALLCLGQRQWPLMLGAGFALGCAMLTRPQGLLVPVVFFLWALAAVARERQVGRWLGQALLVALGLGITVAPWLLRNARLLGVPVLTTTGGINLYLGNHAAADGAYHTTAWFEMMTSANTSEVDENAACRQRALREWRADPWRPLRLVPRKLWRLYAMDTDGAQWTRLASPGLLRERLQLVRAVERLSQWYYLTLWAALGLTLWRRPRPLALGLLMIAAFTGAHLLFYGMPRYHAPMMPWVIMYAAGVLIDWPGRDGSTGRHEERKARRTL